MSFKITCPKCDTRLVLNDQSRGKKIRCKACDKLIAVPAAEVEDFDPIDDDRTQSEPVSRKRSAPSRRDEEDERPRRRDEEDERPSLRRSREPAGVNVGLLIGIGAAVLVVVGGGGIAAWLALRPAPVTGPGGQPMAATPVPGQPPVALPVPAQNPVAANAPVGVAGPAMRYRWQNTPAVYALTASVGNQNDFEVQTGHLIVTARPTGGAGGVGLGNASFTLAFASSLLTSKSPRRSGDVFVPAAGGPPASLPNRRGEIDVDALGKVKGNRNDDNLPGLLGGVCQFLIEPLALGEEPTWEASSNAAIVYTENNNGPRGFGGPPMFRPRGPMGPRGPFGPFGPFGQAAPEKSQAVLKRSVYSRKAVNGNLVTIEKRFELKGDELPPDIPAIVYNGTNTIVFDARDGLPRSMEFKGELVQSLGNVTVRKPVTASYRLVEGAERDKVINYKPPPPPPPKQYSDAEMTTALSDIAGTDGFKRSVALMQLNAAKVEEKHRAKVTKVLTEVAKTEKDGFVRRGCIDALGNWGTTECVPTLLTFMDDKDGFTQGSTIVALGKLKDERAAEPIAKFLDELRHRHAASAALLSIGPKAEKAVAGQLNKLKDGFGKGEALRILKKIGTVQSKPALEEAAKDPDFFVSREAKEILMNLDKK